jgi:hypothetical protein
MARRKEKGERYIDRWLREHPRISLYLKKDEYEKLKSLAESRGMSVKEFIMSLINGFNKYYEEVYRKGYDNGNEDGFNFALQLFYEYPEDFYEFFKKKYPNVEPALFTVPCAICGKPAILTHTHKEWNTKIKPILYHALRGVHHIKCPSSST